MFRIIWTAAVQTAEIAQAMRTVLHCGLLAALCPSRLCGSVRGCLSLPLCLAAALILVGLDSSPAQDQEPYEQSPIHYSTAEPHDPVTRLQARIASGQVRFGSND